ncbi:MULTISPECIES: hypothetical protein [Methanoculleus]|uniref:Uncharacterized protein n=2 Tax=Methanoculleus TaxID=45989 RepID=A3CS02_METMJ|nr:MULTISPECIES: hypothetical protein [Methanoculleus]ABN56152.1 conserved hypothetical protein [Methanoculleus marisnigri JR1]UYU17621.1 hypothetical protein OH143_07840 [Methanoculleus submarinus]
MQIANAPDGTIRVDGKVVTSLDRFVASVTSIIEWYTRYVIVSGYVAILFGRARGTEDIDIFIDYMDYDTFRPFSEDLLAQGFYFLNSDDIEEIYSMLCDRLAVRIAGAGRIIPNIEMKFKKDDFDRYAMSRAKTVEFDDIRFFVSPIELQIPYKLYLGSDKDIEDAVYLWVLFREMLDSELLRSFMERLQVRGEQYGIEV